MLFALYQTDLQNSAQKLSWSYYFKITLFEKNITLVKN